MPITQVIAALPTPPNPATDDNTTFPAKASAFTVAQAAMGPELNTFAGQANTLETNVTTLEASATTSKNAAAASAAAALASQNAAAASQTAAGTSQTAAAASATTAVAAQTAINNRYRGALAADPATRPDASANQTGDYYFNTVSGLVKTYNGATWGASDINTANLAASSGSSLIGHLQGSTGSVAATLAYWASLQPLNLKADFSALGDGVNDTNALNSFFAASTGKVCILPAGTYRATSLISKALTNCRFIGVPGQTTIVGNFGYAVLRLLDLNNVIFEDIIFKTEYVNAVEDNGASVVYSLQDDVINTVFRRCKFSSPSANTSGLTFYARISAADTSGTIDGLWVEDCNFEDVGRMGCTIMNRNTAAYTAAQRVYFNRNKGKNLGLSGSYGFLVSLDGYGQSFEVDRNHIENALGIGIENVGWINGSISHNRFRGFSRVWGAISNSTYAVKGLRIVDNRTMEPASSHSFIGYTNSSEIRDNNIEVVAGVAQAVIFRDCSDNKMSGNTWKSAGSYAALFEYNVGNCKRNESVGDTFDTSGSAANTAALRFQGANCSDNRVFHPVVIKGTGGFNYDEAVNATNNAVLLAANASTDLFMGEFSNPNFTTDADKTLTLQEHSSSYIQMADTGVVLTAARNVILPAQKRQWMCRNGTLQALTFKASTGTGIAIAAGTSAMVFFNGANFVRVTADV